MTIGQFTRRSRPPRTPEEKETEKICTAFNQGAKAARMDKPRSSNHYMPGSEPELYQAWNAGYDEEEPSYQIRKASSNPPACHQDQS